MKIIVTQNEDKTINIHELPIMNIEEIDQTEDPLHFMENLSTENPDHNIPVYIGLPWIGSKKVASLINLNFKDQYLIADLVNMDQDFYFDSFRKLKYPNRKLNIDRKNSNITSLSILGGKLPDPQAEGKILLPNIITFEETFPDIVNFKEIDELAKTITTQYDESDIENPDLEIHKKALAYQKLNPNVNYNDAVFSILRNEDNNNQ